MCRFDLLRERVAQMQARLLPIAAQPLLSLQARIRQSRIRFGSTWPEQVNAVRVMFAVCQRETYFPDDPRGHVFHAPRQRSFNDSGAPVWIKTILP
jgi:hypothetical protein